MKLLLMKPMAREEPDVNGVVVTPETRRSHRGAEHHADLFGIHSGDDMPLEHRVTNRWLNLSRHAEVTVKADCRAPRWWYMRTSADDEQGDSEANQQSCFH